MYFPLTLHDLKLEFHYFVTIEKLGVSFFFFFSSSSNIRARNNFLRGGKNEIGEIKKMELIPVHSCAPPAGDIFFN